MSEGAGVGGGRAPVAPARRTSAVLSVLLDGKEPLPTPVTKPKLDSALCKVCLPRVPGRPGHTPIPVSGRPASQGTWLIFMLPGRFHGGWPGFWSGATCHRTPREG